MNKFILKIKKKQKNSEIQYRGRKKKKKALTDGPASCFWNALVPFSLDLKTFQGMSLNLQDREVSN